MSTQPPSPHSPSTVVVVNPTAGRGRAWRIVDFVTGELTRRGVDHVVCVGTSVAGTIQHTADAIGWGASRVIVVGGDGTMADAVQGLVAQPERTAFRGFAIIPGGTGDDLARSFGIPVHDPAAALDIALGEHVYHLDRVVVRKSDGSERSILTVLALGFDARVNARANRMRRPNGRARYLAAIGIEYLRLKTDHVRAWTRIDGEPGPSVDRDVLLVAVANTRSYGGGLAVAPDADSSDGQLDVVVVDAAGRLRVAQLFGALLGGRHLDRVGVEMLRVSELGIESVGHIAFADGEPIGESPFHLRVVRRDVPVFVPRSGASG